MFLNEQEAMYLEGGVSSSTKLRGRIYKFMHEISQSQTFTPLIYKVLLILEAIQFLWWTIHPRTIAVWDLDVFDWVVQVIKYFQVDGALEDNNSKVFTSVVYVVFAIQILILLIIVLNAYLVSKSSNRKGNSTMLNYSSKILSIYAILLTNILPLPFYQAFFSAFFCFEEDSIHSDLTCYQGTYWIYLILACIGLIILVLTSVPATLFSIELNPWSKTPFSAAQSRLSLIKLGFKILIPLYCSADYKGDFAEGFLVCYAVIWLIILVLRYRQIPNYNRSVFYFTLALEMIIFWTALVTLFHVWFDDDIPDNMGFLFWLVIMPFVTYTYIYVVDRRTKVYRELKLKQLNKDIEVEMYVVNLIDLIEHRDNHHKMITLEGMLKYHARSCMKKNNECYCFDLIANYNSDEEAPEKIWYLWVKSIITEALEKFPKSSKLHLLYAYIQKEKLDNKFKALFELMISLDSKPNTEEEFSIFRYKTIIEEEIIENDIRHIESKGIDVNLIVEFENKFVDFQTAIEAAVEAHLDFWRELLENSPEIQKLQTLGSYITKSLEEAENQYKKLCTINSNHVKMLKIYGNFLKDVVNDESEGQRILDKAEQVDKSSVVNRQFVDDEKLKYGDNANPVIITCSGNFATMGTVLNANNEVFRLLGYSKAEMIGQNIRHIMPKILGDEHDEIMKNYFETAKVKAIGLERQVFPMTKHGYIIPCSLMIKVLPNLAEGLKVVGFLKELERDVVNGHEENEGERNHYVFYDGHSGSIHGVTRSCKKDFGIHASLVRGSNLGTNEFTIDTIFPDLLQCNLDDLRSPNGIITTINTSALKENFMIQNENSDNEESSDQEQVEEENDTRYKIAQVNVNLIQDEDYNEFNLRVLKFVEIIDEGNASNSQFPLEHNNTINKSNVKSDNPRATNIAGEDEVERSVEGGGSEMDSSAPGTEFNEDIRLLKDFKALISEKTLPKSIKILRNAVIIFGIIFIVLISVGLSFNLSELSEFQDGVVAVNTAYTRVDTIADITWKLRKLQLLATDVYQPTGSITEAAVEATLRSQLATLNDNLRNSTLAVGDNEGEISSLGFPQVEVDYVKVESKIQTGTKVEDRLFSDSMSQLASHATSCSNAALNNFVVDDVTDSTKASFFFVRKNGLWPLRVKSESNAEAFKDFYLDRTATYDSRFLIIMVLALAVLVISESILVPIVFSVHKTATKVLSLFGYITQAEINELADRCEIYMDRYLEHRHEKKAYDEEEHEHEGVLEDDARPSKTSRLGGNEYLEVSQSPEDPNGSRAHFTARYDSHNTNKESHNTNKEKEKEAIQEDEVNIEVDANNEEQKPDPASVPGSQMIKSGQEKQLVTKKSLVPKNSKDEEKRLQDEEEAEQGNARSQKLLNSKDNNKGRVILQFTFIAAVIAAYFVADYTTELNSQSNIKKSLEHLRLLSRINMSFRFLASFTLEELGETNRADIYTFPSGVTQLDQRQIYKASSLDAYKLLSDSAKQGFPSEFDGYISLFNLYGNDNICARYYDMNSTIQNYCLGIGGQLLTRGLVLGTTRIAQLTDDLIKDMDTSTPTAIISGDKYQQMEDLLNFIAPVVKTLEQTMVDSFESYLTKVSTIERVKFAIFIVFVFLLFFVIWWPYLRRLKEKIFRTKGMLNMIPMTIITKNESLKSVFIQGDILQAVK